MPGTWGHLVARFFDVVTAKRLSRGEIEAVERWLEVEDIVEAFFEQPVADQRHGFEAALCVVAQRPERLDLIRAALVHDIGKRHARLGPIGRVSASLAIRLGIPLSPRLTLYRDHGEIAAAELSGEEPVVVEFARHHHRARPSTIAADEWRLLISADRPRNPGDGLPGGNR